jgi:hypothetical protein
MDEDTQAAAWFQVELECMEQFETRDKFYDDWLDELAACAAQDDKWQEHLICLDSDSDDSSRFAELDLGQMAPLYGNASVIAAGNQLRARTG